MNVVLLVLTVILVIAAPVSLIVAIISTIRKNKRDMIIFWSIFAVAGVIVLVMYMVGNAKVNQIVESQRPKNDTVPMLTSEEEEAMVDDIIGYLKGMDMFPEGHANVLVSSGGVKADNAEVVVTRTRIYIILDGSYADSLTDAQTLADGYDTAMTLYFGERDRDRYDIYVDIGRDYSFLNAELVEE